MNRVRRVLASLAIVAMMGASIWVVATPLEVSQGTTVAESDPLLVPTANGLDILSAKSIKDPACNKPCRPFVKTKTGLTCVFVGCFTETGECAYRC